MSDLLTKWDTSASCGDSRCHQQINQGWKLSIFTGSVRNDDMSKHYVPVNFPAGVDFRVVKALRRTAEKRWLGHHVGIGHGKNTLYHDHSDHKADPEGLKQKWNTLRRCGVLAIEMKAALLFIGQLRRVRVGTIYTVIGEPVEKVRITFIPLIDKMILTALDALTILKT